MTLSIFQEISVAANEKKYGDIFNGISFIAFCFFMMDCAISGGGRWLMVGSLSLRMLLGLIALVCAIPSMFKNIKDWIKNPMIISLGLFLLYLGVCAYIGFANGNRTDVLLSDIKGFAWLFLMPVAVTVINSRERLRFILKCIVVAATLQALMLIALNIISIFHHNIWSFVDQLEEIQWGNIGLVSDNIYRMFFKSSPYLALACVIMVFFQVQDKKFKWIYAVSTGLCLNAILLTFTRSLYGAAFCALVLVVVLYLIFAPHSWKRLMMHIGVALISAVGIIMLLQAISGANYVKFSVVRTFSLDIISEEDDDDTQEPAQNEKVLKQQQQYLNITRHSDDVREETLKELKEMIGQNYIFGNGLGASIDFREDGLVEYIYHDILNKMGVVGLRALFWPGCIHGIYAGSHVGA